MDNSGCRSPLLPVPSRVRCSPDVRTPRFQIFVRLTAGSEPRRSTPCSAATRTTRTRGCDSAPIRATSSSTKLCSRYDRPHEVPVSLSLTAYLLLLLLLYMSIIMVALSHYCCRTTLQCQYFMHTYIFYFSNPEQT